MKPCIQKNFSPVFLEQRCARTVEGHGVLACDMRSRHVPALPGYRDIPRSAPDFCENWKIFCGSSFYFLKSCQVLCKSLWLEIKTLVFTWNNGLKLGPGVKFDQTFSKKTHLECHSQGLLSESWSFWKINEKYMERCTSDRCHVNFDTEEFSRSWIFTKFFKWNE